MQVHARGGTSYGSLDRVSIGRVSSPTYRLTHRVASYHRCDFPTRRPSSSDLVSDDDFLRRT